MSFGRITDEMYDRKLREYKERQSAILTEMHIHSDADEEFFLTANMVLKLSQRALDIFKSSEVHEKRQFLNFLLQNCRLSDKKLEFDLRYPFDRVLATSNQPIGLRTVESIRTWIHDNQDWYWVPKLEVSL
jgi:hypothetical protein